VERCADCGSPLQTLDLPCPVCVAAQEEARTLRHRFSKTFEIRTAYSYKPDELLHNVNSFLWTQSTVDQMSAHVHLDRQGFVRGITCHCVAGVELVPAAFQFARLRLVKGDLFVRRRQDVGTALNDWADQHPSFRKVNSWVISSHGRATEVWVLYLTPRSRPIDAPAPSDPVPHRGED
jgi:hypothetical protein